MIFRDLNHEYEKPYQDGKWIYPDSIYDNILNCFKFLLFHSRKTKKMRKK